MSQAADKSLQELRAEITRLEGTIAQQREIIKFRGDELTRRCPINIDKVTKERDVAQEAHNDALVRQRQLEYQVQQCVKQVLGMGPNIANIEDCLPSVTARVKDLEKQTEALRQIPVDKRELENLKKERDANMMLALDAQRDFRNERYRSENFKRRVEELESSEELAKLKSELNAALKAKQDMADSSRVVNKKYLELEYKHRDTCTEFDELEKRYEQLQSAEANRTWATTDKNCYNDFLALRDVIVPEFPLGGAREAILRQWNALLAGAQLSERKAQGLQDELQTAKSEWNHERFLKGEIYKLYEELRKLFNLEHAGAIDAEKVHSTIRLMLTRRDELIKSLNETLAKERTLACEEIRRLTDIIKAEGDK